MLRTDRWTRLVAGACAGLVLTAGLAAAQKMGRGVPLTQEAMEKNHGKIEADLQAAGKELGELRQIRERLKKAEVGGAAPSGGACEKGTVEDALAAAGTLGVNSSLMAAKGMAKQTANYYACRAVAAQSEDQCAELKRYGWTGAAQDCRDFAVMALVSKAMATRSGAVAKSVCRFRDLPPGLSGARCEAWAEGAASGASIPQICAKVDAIDGGSAGDCQSLRWIAGLASSGECAAMERSDEKAMCREFSAYRRATKAGASECGGQALCEAMLSGTPAACAKQGLDLKTRICGFSQAQKGVNDAATRLNVKFLAVNDAIEGYQPKSDPWVADVRQRYRDLNSEYRELTAGKKAETGQESPSR